MAKLRQHQTEETGMEEKVVKKKGSWIKSLFIVFLTFVFILLLFLLFLRMNLFGLGSMLAPTLRPFPLSDVYLPPMSETGEVEIDPETGEPIVKEPEETIEEVKENLNLLQTELKKKEEEADILMKQIQSLTSEKERLAVFEKKQLEFEKERAEFDARIVEAGGKQDFTHWYQTMNPDNAARLYQESMAELAVQKELDGLIKVYAEMKPKAAAKVLETMSSTRLEMVAKIIQNLDTDQAGKIMSEIDPKVGARITAYLYPEQQ